MRDREYRIGPGAVSLLLVVVVVSMSALGLLALISARGDYRLSEKAAEVILSEYEAAAEAERAFAELDALLMNSRAAADDAEYLSMIEEALPGKMTLSGRIVSWEEGSEGGRVLLCEAEILPMDSAERYARITFMFSI